VLLREMQISDAHKAFEAYQKLRKGQPFADVAREYAGSPSVQARYFQYDELPEYLQPVLAKTRAGSVTRPIEATPELYQLIIVVQKADRYVLPLSSVEDEIRLQLVDEKGGQRLAQYLAGLRERFPVTVFWAKLPFAYREEAP
jgi:parvulin-like peptidyl-prolyl isomerase